MDRYYLNLEEVLVKLGCVRLLTLELAVLGSCSSRRAWCPQILPVCPPLCCSHCRAPCAPPIRQRVHCASACLFGHHRGTLPSRAWPFYLWLTPSCSPCCRLSTPLLLPVLYVHEVDPPSPGHGRPVQVQLATQPALFH